MELREGRLRALRERKLLTQQQLADAAGMTKTNLNRLERGHQRVRLSTVARLAEVLGVNPAELVHFRDEKAGDENEPVAG